MEMKKISAGRINSTGVEIFYRDGCDGGFKKHHDIQIFESMDIF